MGIILVVDDVPVVRLVIAKILRHAGHSVVEAADGGEALASLRAHRPDAVVTDIWMPGVDGLHLVGAIDTEFHGLPVVAMTGGAPRSCLEDSMQAALDQGVSVVLMKPIDKDELTAAVAEALAMHSTTH